MDCELWCRWIGCWGRLWCCRVVCWMVYGFFCSVGWFWCWWMYCCLLLLCCCGLLLLGWVCRSYLCILMDWIVILECYWRFCWFWSLVGLMGCCYKVWVWVFICWCWVGWLCLWCWWVWLVWLYVVEDWL